MGLFGKKAAPPPPQPVARPPPPPSMLEIITKMRFTSKQVGRHAAKSEKQVLVEQRKSKDALAKGNIDVARIHAESAIRNKNQALHFYRLQAQIEGVASKVQGQELRMQVTESLGEVTGALDAALANMDMGKISEIMEKYVDQVEGLDVTTAFMDQELGETSASAAPQSEVDNYLDRLCVENDLDMRDQLSAVTTPYQAPGAQVAADDTDARFAALSGRPNP
jgi:charged multivesicular body protein 1